MGRLRIFLRVLACVATVFVVLELMARVDDWFAERVPLTANDYTIDRIFAFSADGVKGRPGAHYLKWKLNRVGFRGPELKPEQPRLAVWGASETFGLYEGEGGEYPRQLEHSLAKQCGTGPCWQVVNMALPGSSLSGGLKALDDSLRETPVDVMLVYPSLANSALNPLLDPAAFERKNAKRVVIAPPTPKFRLRISARAGELAKRAAPVWLMHETRRFMTWRAARNRQVYSKIPDDCVSRFRKEIEQVLDLLEARGVKPVLVTHATRFGSEVKPAERYWLTTWRRFYPILDEDGFLDMEIRLNEELRRVAAARKVTLIDAAREMPPGDEYFADFAHFTDRGAERMGRLLADGLAAVGLACPRRG